MSALYTFVTRNPKLVLFVIFSITIYMAMQMGSLRWETDARVYMPKGHPAIQYDEKIEHIFGVKDAFIIGIKNDEKSIYNTETLAKIARITRQVSELPGVIANRTLDVASLATATAFVGTDTAMGAERLMLNVPETQADVEALKTKVQQHADLFVGNLVSADGTAAIIRAKLKEGADNRYQTYWQIKAILAKEMGESSEGQWGDWGGEWGDASNWQSADNQWTKEEQAQWHAEDSEPEVVDDWHQSSADQTAEGEEVAEVEDNGDTFFLAGRPVIEVTSGLHALEDLKVMIPMLLSVMAAALFLIFKTGRGIIIPLGVMAGAIIWTMGSMALLNVPMYTISTMLPVILVAIGIGDSVHLMSNYYNKVFEDPYRPASDVVRDAISELGAPLITTSITTAIGFLALLFADMPPFKVFGLFTVLGIFFSWLFTVTFAAAMLSLMQPRVAGYLAKRRSMRVHTEQDRLTRVLVGTGAALLANRKPALIVLASVLVLAAVGASKLYVNSSWLSDFKEGTEVRVATDILNERLDGSIFLNVVVEADDVGGLKSISLLRKIDALQEYAETLPYVGDSLSVVDFLKSMNKTLHAEDEQYNVLPATTAEISELLYLYSVSGQPELLDEVVDFDYQRANITISIKTDQTKYLRTIIDDLKVFVDTTFKNEKVDVNMAGSANNSYIWAELLIDSQSIAIVFSKVGIFLIAALMFRSWMAGLATVIPVALTTLIVAAAAGWMNIALDVSTALAAGVAIGVGVDYAVHYIFRYTREFNQCGNHEEAVSATLRTVGRTIVFNAVVVSAGFSVLFLSQFPPHVKLGAFVVAYMVISCIVALFILPLVYRRRVAV
ncbi:MAG TPA: hypothetical protein ENK35_08895 [Candidatus Tenderia sp.]|nr:hypothetical protein [Candidatus Tenderia sp.]